MTMEMTETERMLAGQGLTTAQILYRMPDFQTILQSFTWQEYDTAPGFPRLREFLDFWQRELDGPLHSVTYAHRQLIAPGEWRAVNGEFLLN